MDKLLDTALIEVSIEGWLEVIELLLRKGSDINARANDGTTALIWATINGDSEVVALLLDKGADVHVRNKNGVTAASVANERGSARIRQLPAKYAPLE